MPLCAALSDPQSVVWYEVSLTSGQIEAHSRRWLLVCARHGCRRGSAVSLGHGAQT
jgi:hypothetical protein